MAFVIVDVEGSTVVPRPRVADQWACASLPACSTGLAALVEPVAEGAVRCGLGAGAARAASALLLAALAGSTGAARSAGCAGAAAGF
jgi:hypothetical protein